MQSRCAWGSGMFPDCFFHLTTTRDEKQHDMKQLNQTFSLFSLYCARYGKPPPCQARPRTNEIQWGGTSEEPYQRYHLTLRLASADTGEEKKKTKKTEKKKEEEKKGGSGKDKPSGAFFF
ncbi:uncharacterized protein Triagg1_3115 [Trichoderma aggressivum f. europaeum]|uniref:Uncharacterized protein n=1 Tax=Trichoderma aggressivum f. europaeum TaxID=173218 RepID=A0AAE1IG91_9HYPO|nr:hypothetical protein Triagg1_3115 [Trichoderma aggressivum f. europaeum]